MTQKLAKIQITQVFERDKKNDFIFKSIKIDENMLKNRKPIELLI